MSPLPPVSPPQPERLSLPGTAITFDPTSLTGTVRLDGGADVGYDAVAFLAGGLRLLRPGQRVRIDTVDGLVTLVSLPTLHQEST